ncbi:MAG: hypothetical protein QXI43_06315 [Candidatus Nitrosocaldus sp.]
MRRLSAIENHMLKVNLVYKHMLENPEEYIVQVDKVRGMIRFIPLTARVFYYSFISKHTAYRVYMSATISKELLLCKELGIAEGGGEGERKEEEGKKEKAYYYIVDLPSPFPVENRKVYLLNTVKLSNEALRSNEKETMSKLVASIITSNKRIIAYN